MFSLSSGRFSLRAVGCVSLSTLVLAACGGGGGGAVDGAAGLESSALADGAVSAQASTDTQISLPGSDLTPSFVPDPKSTSAATSASPVPAGPVATAASCSIDAVRLAVNAAASGTTVMVPAGDCNWGTQQLDVPGGIYLKGAGKNSTVIRRSGSVPETRFLVSFNCSNGGRATLSDMTLVGNGTAVWDKGLGLNNGCVDFKVFNAKFTKWTFAAIEVRGAIKQRGVIYSNDFIDNYSSAVRNLGYGVAVYADSTWPALDLGSQNAVYVENNYMSGNRHHVASNDSSRYVFRYNNVVATDLTKDFAMTDAHGKSSSPRGSRSFEIYNNTYSAKLSAGLVNTSIGIRGGDGVIFNNSIGDGIARPIAISPEGFACGTYPGTDQTRDLHIWNNSRSTVYPGYTDDAGVNNQCAASVKLDRDYFVSKKPGYTPFTYPHPLRS